MTSEPPFDPFQVFEVFHKNCLVVYVKVVRGRNITKGWAQDLMDTPDPYVILTLANSPYAWRKTSVKDNDPNPEWQETFTFWLDLDQAHTLEMSLMDANYTVDEHLASSSLPLSPLPVSKKLKTTIRFNATSEVDIEVWAEIIGKSDLRFSLTLCPEEKKFIELRKKKILRALKTHFGFASPRNHQEVPVIAVIGSGGGFRAMIAYSGVFSALSQLGVVDMVTYTAGLSGSAWYLSQLYSHPEWPNISPGDQREEIKKNIDHSFLWLLKSHGLTFVKDVWTKRSRGEPVSFTDLFGHLVGHTLLKTRLHAKLSDQQKVVSAGQCPLPLYTCLHVKKTVSAMIFHEWMEFSPYEIGLPKYGTFLKVEQFSCKFFMGSVIKEFPEPPLHFLQGIWGSAFCIQFKRLLGDDKNVDTVELMRREREELEEELKKDMAACDVADSESNDDDDMDTHGVKTTGGLQRKRSKSSRMKQKSFWDSMVSRMLESRWFQSIELRAAQVFNFMRGLSLNNVYPFSPFTKTQEEEDDSNTSTFGGIFDLHPTSVKKLYVVDSGLTFNSPFPVVLRPQREVDIILSFDFSARPTDDTQPFKELLLAAKWAELNKIPFPPIDPSVMKKEGLKECYVFKHPWDPNCPIVLHFCLVNINFKREVMPGICRTTKEELDFGNFNIFDDPAHPYSTFKFTYTHLEFERLSKLMEYNTLLCKDVIFDNISTCIKRRRRFSIRRPCTTKDIARLSLNSRAKADKLAEYITMVEKVSALNEKSNQEYMKTETQEWRIHQSVRTQVETSHSKFRPISLPVKSIEDVSYSDEEDISAGNLQRSLDTTRHSFGLSGGRKKFLDPAMSQVEEVDELEDLSPLSNSTSPARSPKSTRCALIRSRPVRAFMRPIMLSNQSSNVASLSDDQMSDNATSINKQKFLVENTPGTLQKLQTSAKSQDVDNQNIISPVSFSDKNGGAVESTSAVNRANNSRTDSSDLVHNDNTNRHKNSNISAGQSPLEEWIDNAERVTDL